MPQKRLGLVLIDQKPYGASPIAPQRRFDGLNEGALPGDRQANWLRDAKIENYGVLHDKDGRRRQRWWPQGRRRVAQFIEDAAVRLRDILRQLELKVAAAFGKSVRADDHQLDFADFGCGDGHRLVNALKRFDARRSSNA